MGRTQNISKNICSFGNGTPNQQAPTKKSPCIIWQIDKTPFKNKIYR